VPECTELGSRECQGGREIDHWGFSKKAISWCTWRKFHRRSFDIRAKI